MKNLFLILLVFVVITACRDDKPEQPDPPAQDELSMTIQPTYGTVDLQLDQTYTTDEGYLVQFTDLKCYMTDVRNGSSVLCSSALFDYREKGTSFFRKVGKPGEYPSLDTYLGVPSERNHGDPTALSTSDPLYITNANDMHWGWNPGYIFIKVEAKVDTIPDATENFDHLVVFHVGGDTYIRDLNFSSLTWNASGANHFVCPLKLDMKKFLNNGTQSIDLKTEFSSHTAPGQEAISTKVIDHFAGAISLY
jgi:hypothetical protein